MGKYFLLAIGFCVAGPLLIPDTCGVAGKEMKTVRGSTGISPVNTGKWEISEDGNSVMIRAGMLSGTMEISYRRRYL